MKPTIKFFILLIILFYNTVAFAQTDYYTKYLKEGNNFYEKEEYLTALERYDLAYNFTKDNTQKDLLNTKRNLCRTKIRQQQTQIQNALANTTQLLRAFVPDTVKLFYAYFRNIAANYMEEANYTQAFRYYRFARLSPDLPTNESAAITEMEKKAENLLKLNKQAVEFFRDLKFSEAEKLYAQMLQLMPNDTIINQRIWHCQNPAFKKENLVYIKGATFTMGCDKSYAQSDETPHTVTLTDFYMGKYEVTNAEFAEFLNIYGSNKVLDGLYKDEYMVDYGWFGIVKKGKLWLIDDQYGDKKNYPVMRVSWYGANEFCKFWKGTLPSESQWEYAAGSGGKGYKYSWGNNEPGETKVANLADETAKKVNPAWFIETGYTDGFAQTAPVGSFPANELGLFDMSGNVFEWCLDWYDGDFYKKSGGKTNPVNSITNQDRVLRSGSWDNVAAYSRIANRSSNAPAYRDDYIGFRLVFVP